ncbi:hypothetical protein P4B35_16615 [Pontiellaceae bacterium B12227]|nr:hypothetical protein [Pontiellaceae bacterium B12227]
MNNTTSKITVGITSLVTLISLASAISLSSKNKAAKAEILALQTQIVNMEAHIPDSSPEPEIIYLTSEGDTNELTTLKTALAEKEALLEDIQSNTNRPARKQRESFEDRMAKMKAEDPEGYAEMIQKREERSNEMRYALAERTATFMDLDTSNMTEEELANHEMLVSKMAKVWELSDQFQDPEAPPNREAMREMFTEMREVRPLLEVERNVMFKQLGTDLGYEGEDTEAFATHLQEIIEATSVQMPGGGRGGGDRGGGDRGGGGGGRGR